MYNIEIVYIKQPWFVNCLHTIAHYVYPVTMDAKIKTTNKLENKIKYKLT